MPQYFSEGVVQDLNKHQEKAMSDQRLYGPALNFLYRREEDFQTNDLVESVSSGLSGSDVDSHRAGRILGALRDEYGLIDGYFEEGSYYWDPELQAEGDWKDVKQELSRINETGKTQI